MQPSSFLTAVQQGDVSTVERYLHEGADPNFQDASGRTALHYAVESRNAQMAACLLIYRANYRIVDNDGVAPLDSRFVPIELLHNIRQRYQRFHRNGNNGTEPIADDVRSYSEELDRRGLVKLSGLIPDDTLAQMRRDFQKFILELSVRIARGSGVYKHYDEELHWRAEDLAYVTNNAFKYSRALVRLCCHPTISGVANRYLGRPAYIQRGVAMRYLPADGIERDMFGWHHDIEEQRCKMMILLTDVAETDQFMSYIAGSHKLYHPYEMFHENTCSPDYCQQHLGVIEILKTTGKAGDIFLFDSNGAHRGNRSSKAAVRDAFFIEYTVDKSGTWGGDIDPQVFEGIALNGPNPFERMLTSEKRWTQSLTRLETDWVLNLPRVESWI